MDKKQIEREGIRKKESVIKFVLKNKDYLFSWYEEESGEKPKDIHTDSIEDLTEEEEAFIQEVAGRYIFYYCFDKDFKQNSFESQFDGIASGHTLEVKLCYYPFNDDTYSANTPDYRKIRDMEDEGHIVFIYPDMAKGEHKARLYEAGDIKIYGEIRRRGGKVNNRDKAPSRKPLYYVPHNRACDERVWKKEGNKS